MKWFLYLVITKERLLSEQYQLTAHLPLSFCGKIDPFMHNPPSEFNIPLGLSYGLADCNTNFWNSTGLFALFVAVNTGAAEIF